MSKNASTDTLPPERATYTIVEAAEILGIARSSAYRAARTGELPTIKIGRRILVGRQALTDIIDQHGRTVAMQFDKQTAN
jgi:excisionase family DNA binding protein